jgi:hypothetical protein
LPPSPVSYKLLKPQTQGSPYSQESQAVCTKHVHGIGQSFSVFDA